MFFATISTPPAQFMLAAGYQILRRRTLSSPRRRGVNLRQLDRVRYVHS